MRFLRLICILGLFKSSIVFAHKWNTDTAYLNLDTIVVKNRIVTTKKNWIPYSIVQKSLTEDRSVLDRSIPEFLMGVSGVFVQKTNHGGGSAFLRGLTGNQTLLILDGVRINNATFRYGPNQYLNTIDLYSIQQIDVYKGTGSVEYGSDAIGGTIYLQTSLPNFMDQKKWSGKLLMKHTGDQMENTVRAVAKYSSTNLAIQTGFTSKKFGDLVGGNGVGKQSPSGYNEDAMDTKIRLRLSKNNSLIYSTQVLLQRNVPIYHKIVLEQFKLNEIKKQEKQIHYLKWEKLSPNKWWSKLQLTQSYQYSHEERLNQKNNTSIYKKEKDLVQTHGISLDLYSNPSNKWLFNTGIDYYKDIIKSQLIEQNLSSGVAHIKRGLYPNDSKYASLSIFHLHKINVDKWHLELGARWNHFNIQMFDSTIGAIKLMPNAVVGNIGATRQINTDQYIYTAISNGYRAPNIDDLGSLGIVDFRYEMPVKNLAPEKSINYELGYKLNSKKIKIDVNLFYCNLKDIISRQRMPGSLFNDIPIYAKKNTEKAFIKGFETNVNYVITKQINWTANMTFTYGQNVSKNEPMRRIPPLFGQQHLSWGKSNLFIQISHLFAGKQTRLAQGDIDDNRIGQFGTPYWNLFNIYMKNHFKNITLEIAGLNLLNEKYKTHGSGIYGMGKSYSILVQYNL